MKTNVLKRLEKVERIFAEGPQDIEGQKKLAELTLLLQYHDYLQKQIESIMTPEERRKADEETVKQIVDWYAAYSLLSPEKQKRQNEIRETEIAKELEQFNAQLNQTD